MQRRVAFFQVAFLNSVKLLPHLSKTTDCSYEELNDQQQGRRKDNQGYQTGRISRRRNLGSREDEEKEKRGHQGQATQTQVHPPNIKERKEYRE